MKAPDKIYLPGDIDWPSSAILTLGNQPGDVEYIRKDSLLEWAKEELSKASVSSSSIGRRNAFIDVVNKLNSM